MRIPFIEAKERPSRAVPVVLLSVLFGLAAGLVGTLLMSTYFTPPSQAYGTVYSPVSGRTTTPVDAIVRLPVSVTTASRSVAMFIPAGARNGRLHARSVLPGEATGAGMVLTSDGWLISHISAFEGDITGLPATTEAVIGTRVYAIERAMSDPFTGVVFLKIDAANLPVTVFDAEGSVLAGETAYSFDTAGGPRRVEVISYDTVPPGAAKDLIRSSERMQRALRLSRPDAEILPGSMVVNGGGQVIGVYAGDAAVGAYAVPYAAFEGQIGNVLRDGHAIRPYLGVQYLDLPTLVGITDSSERLRGALLVASADRSRAAVTRLSPAEEGGLKEGDLILAVNGEELTANKALADLIAEYPPGTTVAVTVRPSYTEDMDGPELTVEVRITLGAI